MSYDIFRVNLLSDYQDIDFFGNYIEQGGYMNKIKKVSKCFRIFFQIMLIVIPIGQFMTWLLLNTKYDIFTPIGVGPNMLSGQITVNLLTRVLGITISCLPIGIVLYSLYQLIKLFKNYEKEQVFSINNAIRYQKLGYAMLAWVFADIIYYALIPLALTFQNFPHHQLILSISFGNFDFARLVAGGIILIIAWVMKEAYKMSNEQSLMI